MPTTTLTKAPEAATKQTVRSVGNQFPAFLLGKPRSFWTDVMGPKKPVDPAPIFRLDDFDVAAIIDELHYGTDCEWAA